MKMPFFASFIIFILWLSYELMKSRKNDSKIVQDFWQKEADANDTRKKSLDSLDYVTIPFSSLPMDTMAGDDTIHNLHQELYALENEKIVNFTGISNTNLKLQYGAANLPLLAAYDQNFTTLVRLLQKWAKFLYDNQFLAEARLVLEFAISIKSDISSSYDLLARIYVEQGVPERIDGLIRVAEGLNSALKNAIVRMLKKRSQDNGLLRF